MVAENAVRLVPGTDLGVAVQAAPGDIEPWLQLLGNLLLLLPLGALLPLRLAAVDTCAKAALVVLAATCCIELVQYALLTGRVVSADDVLLNTAGGLAGALLSRRWWADFRVPRLRQAAARARAAAALRPQYARPHSG
ncbi:VanZ family protein [Saccharopolyspora erythraea]|nr:VanZ family protein [Saccharopolyspora erythraea]